MVIWQADQRQRKVDKWILYKKRLVKLCMIYECMPFQTSFINKPSFLLFT